MPLNIKEKFKSLRRSLSVAQKIYVESDTEDLIYETSGNIGLKVMSSEDVILLPGETKKVPTGLRILIPDGYELQSRQIDTILLNTPLRIEGVTSSLSSDGLSDIGVIITNTSSPFGHYKYNAYDYYNDYNYINYALAYPISDNNKMTLKVNKDPYTLKSTGNKNGVYMIKNGDIIARIVFSRIENFNLIQDAFELHHRKHKR